MVRNGMTQAAPPVATPAATKPPMDEAVVLSPFEVSMSTDDGYAARETLAGTRFKSNLKDVASQVSIMTMEFLADTASVSIDDAYRYSLNVENVTEYNSPTAGGGDFTGGTLNLRSTNRIRGLSTPGLTHDFFLTQVLQDAYNLERVSVSSGPNAILFGNGSPGGIVDASFKRAQLQRPKYDVSFRNDNYGSFRTAVDLNQPLVKDRLALRFDAVKANNYTWRGDPSGRDDWRYYGAITAKPFKLTILRAYFESSSVNQTPPRNTRIGDRVTPWIRAGRPAFDNGLTSPTALTAANASIFARETLANNILVQGYYSGPPMQIFGSAAAANIALPTTRYTAKTVGPGDSPNQSGVDVYIYSLPHDERISPYDTLANGNGTRNLLRGKIYGLSFEQDLTHHLFFQADYNRERTLNPTADILRGGDSAIYADANLFASDRVTANPNFGRYYVQTSGSTRTWVFRNVKEESRLMLSYEADFTQRENWLKWAGRHQWAAMYQRSEDFGQQQEFGPMVVPAGTAPDTILNNTGAGTYRTFGVRAYLSDPTKPETGKTFGVALPFDPLNANGYVLPDGSTYYAGYQNPFGGQGAATMNNNLLEGRVVVMQNYWLKDRLVTSFGMRRDNTRQASYVTPRKTSAASSAFVSIVDTPPPSNWSTFTAGNTKTMGVVAHVLPWVSVFLNKSSTWNPPTGLINPDDGTQIPGGTGKGKDYGVMMRFWSDKLSLRMNRFENTSGPSANTGFRNAVVPTVQDIENTLVDRTADETIKGVARPANYDSKQATYALSGLFSDLVSKGTEVEAAFNPNRNWRLSLNGSHQTATQSNIGRSWINFVEQRAPIWTQHATLTGPGSQTTTIATRYLSIIQVLNQMKQADGQMVEDGRSYRVNAFGRYTFTETMFKGAFVGGGYRWRSQQTLGYKSSLVDNAFKFAGAPAQVQVPALDAPVFGKPIEETELLFGYQRKIGQKVMWRGQLNIRNVFDARTIMGQRSNLSGFISVYAVPEPRSFILTNSFTF